MRIWYRTLCLILPFMVLLSAVASANAESLRQSSKPRASEVTIKYKVSAKRLPIQKIGESLRSTNSGTATVPAPNSPEVSPQPQTPAQFSPMPLSTAPGVLGISGELTNRMTPSTQSAAPDSPYYQTTWLTYYGRPNVAVMGILGEYGIDDLTQLLRQKAAEYDAANGPNIGVKPAFHLVYGMATRSANLDGTHLVFLDDDVVMSYINRAAAEGFAVILDIQIGALTPVESMRRGLKYLQYPNVHLGIDPEFAMVRADQKYPGSPIGHITGQQVNEVQAAIQQHMDTNGISGSRILLVHQFIEGMIVDKPAISPSYPVALTISVDGWGPPAEKIRKYNIFTADNSVEFSAFKLFYQWDSPVLSERHALGAEPYVGQLGVDIVPNMIIYQ